MTMAKANLRPPLTFQQAADELGLSIHTLRAWKAQRRIGYIQLGRSVRIPRSEVERILEENTIPPAAGSD